MVGGVFLAVGYWSAASARKQFYPFFTEGAVSGSGSEFSIFWLPFISFLSGSTLLFFLRSTLSIPKISYPR